jgi:hypothetical protein
MEAITRKPVKKQATTRKKMPKVFRESICNHCNWNIATYYKKTILVDLSAPPKAALKGLTHAEKLALLEGFYQELISLFKVYISIWGKVHSTKWKDNYIRWKPAPQKTLRRKPTITNLTISTWFSGLLSG